jgi:hypothetical protein
MDEANSALDWAQNALNTDYADSNFFNVTAYAEQQMQTVQSRLADTAALLANLNVTNNGGTVVL